MLVRSAARLGGLCSSVSSTTAASAVVGLQASVLPPLSSSTTPAIPTASAIGGVRFATSKAGGSTKNGRDSKPKYLGVRRYGGHWVEPGNIILLQRGQKYGIVESTQTVAFGKDWNIYALKPGYVHFWWHAMKKKYFVEVVRSCPGGDGQPIDKYPIVRLKDWELPELLKIPADTPISDTIRQRLIDCLKALPPSKMGVMLPRGKVFVGGVSYETVTKEMAAEGAEAVAAVPPPAAAAASKVAAAMA
jgi:large subunit ribosomal protein L27